jgi:hypothetical protein
LANKKAQGMIVDLILLVLISSVFFLFLSHQTAEQSVNAGIIRSQSAYVQKLLISTLDYKIENGTYQNATISELIGMSYCPDSSVYKTEINDSVNYIIEKLNKENYYFIFTYGDTVNRAVYNNLSCIKTERINLAIADLQLPCGNVTVKLGIWPTMMEVESCE